MTLEQKTTNVIAVSRLGIKFAKVKDELTRVEGCSEQAEVDEERSVIMMKGRYNKWKYTYNSGRIMKEEKMETYRTPPAISNTNSFIIKTMGRLMSMMLPTM